jgi:hypothetical protein
MESRLQTASRQIDLIPSDQMDAAIFADDENRPGRRRATAARLFAIDRPAYERAVSLLAEGHGLIWIGERLGLDPRTVAAIREAERVPIAEQRAALAADWRSASRLCVEGLLEDLSDPERRRSMRRADLIRLAEIATDRAELLAGGATARVEHVHQPSADDVIALMDRAARAARASRREGAGMDLDGEDFAGAIRPGQVGEDLRRGAIDVEAGDLAAGGERAPDGLDVMDSHMRAGLSTAIPAPAAAPAASAATAGGSPEGAQAGDLAAAAAAGGAVAQGEGGVSRAPAPRPGVDGSSPSGFLQGDSDSGGKERHEEGGVSE